MLVSPSAFAPVNLYEVANSIYLPQDKPVAPLILAISPCRSGSTVLLRVFGASGIPAYFQPLKNTLRWAMIGKPWQWNFPTGDSPVFIKETLGPYTLLEAEFNPFEVLQKLDYPMESLRVLFIGRDPLYTWDSWRINWGYKTSVDIMITAYKQVEIIRQQVKAAGLHAVHFVYEAIRDFGPKVAIQGLFDQLNLPFTELAVSGWKNLPAYGAPGSNIYCDFEPEPFVVPHIHERVEKAECLHFCNGHNPLQSCEREDVQKIHASHLDEIYAAWRDEAYSYLTK